MKKVIPLSSADRDSYTATAAETAAAAERSRSESDTARALALPGSGPEQQLLLLQRIIGCIDVETLIARFHRWAHDLQLADGTSFRFPTTERELVLGEKPHHSAQYDLNLDGRPLGTITLRRRQRFSENELLALEQALGPLSRCLDTALENEALKLLVSRDTLTGIGNRRSLHESIEREVSLAQRHGSPLSVMMIDVDHFKQINDKHGHLGGDHVLKTIARVLSRSTRKSDLLFRFGGDEFTIILPQTDLDGAISAAEQIRANLERLKPDDFGLGEETDTLLPGLSIGIARFHLGDDDESLLQRADTHLYHAKAQGRGRVCSTV